MAQQYIKLVYTTRVCIDVYLEVLDTRTGAAALLFFRYCVSAITDGGIPFHVITLSRIIIDLIAVTKIVHHK